MYFSRSFILLVFTVIVTSLGVKTTKIERRDKKHLNIDTGNDPDSSNEESVTRTYNYVYHLTEEEEQDNPELMPLVTTQAVDDGSDEEQIQVPHIRTNKLVTNDDSFSASLLLDIRDMLYREKEEKNQLFIPRAEKQRLENLALQTQASVDSMADDIERYRDFTDEKVNLVLETFSTLKLLVVSQGNQLKAAMDNLGQLEDKISHLEMQLNGFQNSIYDVNSSLKFSSFDRQDTNEPEKEFSGESPSLNNPDIMQLGALPSLMSLNNKINSVTRTVNSMQDELRGLHSNVTELIAVSQVLTIHEKPSNQTPIITQGQNCQCPVEDDLRESIATLEEGQQVQKIYVDELARNLTRLQELQHQEQPDSTFNNRLGEVEGSLRDFNTVKREVTVVKESLDSLTQKLDHIGITEDTAALFRNATISTVTKGLCVWPYTRCGHGCFYVYNNKRLNWMAARDHCRSIQGDLAAPTSYDDFKHFIGQQRLSRAYTYWVGASDIDQEGSWTWVDGRPINQNSTLWASNEPSNSRSSNCMAFKPSNKFEFVATDEECRISRYFICEQERHT